MKKTITYITSFFDSNSKSQTEENVAPAQATLVTPSPVQPESQPFSQASSNSSSVDQMVLETVRRQTFS